MVTLNEMIETIHKEAQRSQICGDIKLKYLLRAFMRIFFDLPELISKVYFILKDHDDYFVGYYLLLDELEILYKENIFDNKISSLRFKRSLCEYAKYHLKDDE